MQFLKLLERAKTTVPTSPHQASRVHGCHRLSVDGGGAETCPGTNAHPRPRRSGFNASRRVRLVHANRRGTERPGATERNFDRGSTEPEGLDVDKRPAHSRRRSDSLLETSPADLVVLETEEVTFLPFTPSPTTFPSIFSLGCSCDLNSALNLPTNVKNMALVSQSATPVACRSDQVQRINQN
jgi:hypothetical protein